MLIYVTYANLEQTAVIATYDDNAQLTIPVASGNRHWTEVQEWVDQGGVIEEMPNDYCVLIDGVWTYDPVKHVERRCKEVDALRELKYSEPMEYPADSGQFWQVDRVSQASIQYRTTYATAAILGDSPPEVIWEGDYKSWRNVDNSYVTFSTAQDFMSFAKAVSDHCNAIFIQGTVHKDALLAMVDPTYEQVRDYDITTGW